MSDKNKDCRACANCYMEPDTDFICGHKDAGMFGIYTKYASSENGHCGPHKVKFIQHPSRKENGDLIER